MAWSWCSVLAYAGDGGPQLEREQALKKVFIKVLKEQGRQTMSYKFCGVARVKGIVKTYSDYIKSLFLGEHNSIDLDDEDVDKIKAGDPESWITLEKVLRKLSGEKFIFAQKEGVITEVLPELLFLVTFDSYAGTLVRNPCKEEPEEPKSGTISQEDGITAPQDVVIPRYSAILPYPPRPALGEYTVTEQQL